MTHERDPRPAARRLRAAARALAPLAFAALAPHATAQWCDGPLPNPSLPAAASASAPGHEKFRLVAMQCDVLAAPAQVRRAAQLGLYDAGAGAGTGTGTGAAAPGRAAAPPEAAESLGLRLSAPVDGSAGRVLSLVPAITDAAHAYGIDPLLLHAIAHVESRHRAGAVSPAGARGVMQVMPATARRFGVGDPERTLFDPATNLRASAAYLRTLRERYGGDLRLMLAAYNAGEGAVEKHGRDVPPYAETQAYVRDVLAIHRRLTAAFTVTPAGTIVAKRGTGDAR